MTSGEGTPGQGQARARVLRLETGTWADDRLAREEPLELRLRAGGDTRTLAVTMRTPGQDFELAAGYLYAEGVVASRSDLRSIRYCVDREAGEAQRYNAVRADLVRAELPPLAGLERYGVISSACGICGKTSLEALSARGLERVPLGFTVPAEVLFALPERLKAAQRHFAATGGLHAAGLFSANGELLAVREDVGRHNALDKLVGWALLEDQLPLSECVLLVSGRASFELVQKAAAAGIPVMAAVSAPSSLAVATAQRFGVTLLGFLREGRANVYAHPERVGQSAEG